eukprot:COSAG06_NODE_1364_length_9696_cov_14.104929_4_plen_105_part_00
MAPVTPFIVEHMFQNLKRIAPKAQRVDSVHYLMMPQPIEVGQSCVISGDLNGKNRPSQIKHAQLCLLLLTRAYFPQAYQSADAFLPPNLPRQSQDTAGIAQLAH